MLSTVDGQARVDGLLGLCVDMLDVSGASIAVIGDGQHLGSFAATSVAIAAVDDLQFGLGEGPCISADRQLGAVLEPNLACVKGWWPAYAAAALDQGIAAVFAFPLHVGAVRLGVLTLYRAEPGDLAAADLADAVALARVATHLLLELEGDLPPGSLPDHLADIVDHRASVHQATGMVAAQLDANVRVALSRLRAFAWSRERSLDDVADDVVARRLRFDDR
jgi:ANTAR domain